MTRDTRQTIGEVDGDERSDQVACLFLHGFFDSHPHGSPCGFLPIHSYATILSLAGTWSFPFILLGLLLLMFWFSVGWLACLLVSFASSHISIIIIITVTALGLIQYIIMHATYA